MTILYTAHASAKGGRDGYARTDDQKLDLKLSPPGTSGPGTNPEQLFAAGYAGCFGQALLAMASKEGLKASHIGVNVDVNLHKDDSGFSLSVKLDAQTEGITQQEAEKIVKLAHEICPYSKATRGNILVTLAANGQDVTP